MKETRKGCPSHDRHARRAGIQLLGQGGVGDYMIRLTQRHQHIRAVLEKLALIAEKHLHIRLTQHTAAQRACGRTVIGYP